LKNWKMKPILSRRTRVSASSDSPASAGAVDATISAGGRPVEAADQVEQRGLARPDGPTIETISPRGGPIRSAATGSDLWPLFSFSDDFRGGGRDATTRRRFA
jgi:hypothetical protein